jgi:hypothetical protein
MKSILATICFLGFVGAFFAIWGIVGGIECDRISVSTGSFLTAGIMAVLAACVFGLMKIEKDEEESKYDRL